MVQGLNLTEKCVSCRAEAGPSSLFEALRAGNPSITEDELLRDKEGLQGKQRKYLEEKQRQKVLQRLERRIGKNLISRACYE